MALWLHKPLASYGSFFFLRYFRAHMVIWTQMCPVKKIGVGMIQDTGYRKQYSNGRLNLTLVNRDLFYCYNNFEDDILPPPHQFELWK